MPRALAKEICTEDEPALDTSEFAELSETIGIDGVSELVWIFETETRRRLRRLTAGGLDIASTRREMHTLKGAAGIVAAPRLTALGRRLEQAANQGIAPTPGDLRAIGDALEAFLAALRARDG